MDACDRDPTIEDAYETRTESLRHLTQSSPVLPFSSPEIEKRLLVLTQVAEVLGIDDLSFLSYSSAISQLSEERSSLKRSILRWEQVERELQAHLHSAKHEERLIVQWTGKLQTEYAADQAEAMERKREALLRKAKEYQRELDKIMESMPAEPTITITQLIDQQDQLRRKEQDIKAKRAKIKVFQGLPPNLDLARMELRRARQEQMKLIRLREELLAKMADAVA